MSDPERREALELYFEKNRLSEKTREHLSNRFVQGQERFPDLVLCPISSCRYPLGIQKQKDELLLLCPHCGYTERIPIHPVL